MLNCNEVNDLISLYIDGELGEKEREEFEKHIVSCVSCSSKFDEISQLVFACRELGEEELPEGFTEELHMKLAAVNTKENSRTKIFNFTTAKMKIFSSVAAGIVLIIAAAFLLKSTILMPSTDGSNSKSMILAEKSVNDSAMKEKAPARKTVGDSSNQLNASGKSDGALADSQKSTSTASSTSAGNSLIAPDSSAGSALTGNGTTVMKAQSDNTVSAGNSGSGGQSISALDALADNTPKKSTAKLQIYAGNVNTLASELEKIVKSTEGERVAQDITLMSYTTSSNQSNSELTVEYKIPNNQYSNFLNSIITIYGQSEVEVDKPEMQDLSVSLEKLNKQAVELDTKLKEAENNETMLTKTEILNLKDEKKVIDTQIEEINAQSDFTYITITIKEK